MAPKNNLLKSATPLLVMEAGMPKAIGKVTVYHLYYYNQATTLSLTVPAPVF
jgi:hypothetical protein